MQVEVSSPVPSPESCAVGFEAKEEDTSTLSLEASDLGAWTEWPGAAKMGEFPMVVVAAAAVGTLQWSRMNSGGRAIICSRAWGAAR